MGGAILADMPNLEELQRLVEEDPFVAEGVATANMIEITPPQQADERLKWLLAEEK